MSGKKTLGQLKDAIVRAKQGGDIAMLRQIAAELEAYGTAQGMAAQAVAKGFAQECNGAHPELIESLLRALALQDDLGDRVLLQEVLSSLGTAYLNVGKGNEAIRYWSRLLALSEERGDLAELARITGKIGSTYRQLGSYPLAADMLNRSLLLHVESGDRIGAARITAELGTVNYYTGNYTRALEQWHQAVAVLEEFEEHSVVARITGNMGNVHMSMGDYAQALEHYHRALALHEELGESNSIALVTRNLGNVYRNTGNYPQALEHFHRSLTCFEDLGNASSIAHTTCSIGLVYADACDYPLALTYLHRSLALHEEHGDRPAIAHVTGHIGSVHLSTNDYQLALDYMQRALTTHEELGERTATARVTGNIGLVHSATGNYPQALEFFRRALALHEEIGNRGSTARISVNMLRTLIRAKMYDEAEVHLATMDATRIDDPIVVVGREISRALILRDHGAIEASHQTLQAALSIAHDHSLLAEMADLHEQLRDLCEPRSDLAGYIHHNREFLRISAEINGKDTSAKMAMQEKQREIDVVQREHQQHMTVLHSTLPRHIADRVARGERVNDEHNNTAVLFLDVVGFTTQTAKLDASSVVDLLQRIFTTFDAICAHYSVMKIKTIGDAYMAVAFPSEHHVADLASAAQAMVSSTFTWPHSGERVQFRIGLHIGPVIAGILGTERIQYDVWGDTVNVASRMESTGEAGRVQVSEAFAQQLNASPSQSLERGASEGGGVRYWTTERGAVEVKGKGSMTTYWLEGAT